MPSGVGKKENPLRALWSARMYLRWTAQVILLDFLPLVLQRVKHPKVLQIRGSHTRINEATKENEKMLPHGHPMTTAGTWAHLRFHLFPCSFRDRIDPELMSEQVDARRDSDESWSASYSQIRLQSTIIGPHLWANRPFDAQSEALAGFCLR